MKRILSLAFAVCILYGCGTDYAYALHNPFSKKSKREAEKMVQTREEWEEKAKNINLEERDVPQYQRPEDKDFKPKSPPSKKFVKYNVNPGSREADISQIIKKQDIKSQGVFDPDFKYIAYAQYYYSPLYDQISSDIYVQKLKDGMTRMKKALSATTLNTKRTPAISSGTEEFRRNLFSTLTIVDFSKDSKKLLVKEKVGSSVEGIFRTYVWVYFMQGEQIEWFAIKFNNLNEQIKEFHARKSHIALDNYRWDIKPLGFSKENPDTIISEAYAWDKDKNKIFLGVWGLNCKDASVQLLSETPAPFEISINALMVKEYLP